MVLVLYVFWLTHTAGKYKNVYSDKNNNNNNNNNKSVFRVWGKQAENNKILTIQS